MKLQCLGIDQSFTSTGVVVVREGRTTPVFHDRIRTSKADGDSDERIAFIIDNIMGIVDEYEPNLTCVESTAYGMVGKGMVFQLGELSGAIKAALFRSGTSFVVANIGTWKKHTTGNGNAGKPLVQAAARALWPKCPTVTDISDAYLIARWGLDNLTGAV